MYICDIYQSSLKFYCQRFSNNATPIFTDQELLTVYLFCGAYQRYFQIKEIHTFTEEYLLSWFPNLPSYQTFNYRLNLMSEAISELVKHLITFFKPEDCDSMTSLIDSMPIITCFFLRSCWSKPFFFLYDEMISPIEYIHTPLFFHFVDFKYLFSLHSI